MVVESLVTKYDRLNFIILMNFGKTTLALLFAEIEHGYVD
jgi:hypothetical protein